MTQNGPLEPLGVRTKLGAKFRARCRDAKLTGYDDLQLSALRAPGLHEVHLVLLCPRAPPNLFCNQHNTNKLKNLSAALSLIVEEGRNNIDVT